jgi:hypothetical protein
MKKVDKDLLEVIQSVFTQDGDIIIDKSDLQKLQKEAIEMHYMEFTADDEYRAVRIGERIRCSLERFGNDNNKAALYFYGDPSMDELAEMLDGLHGKTNEIIWGSYSEMNLEGTMLKTALLFCEYASDAKSKNSDK